MKKIFLTSVVSVCCCLLFSSCGVSSQIFSGAVQIAGKWLATEGINRAEEENWFDEPTLSQAKDIAAGFWSEKEMQSRSAWKKATTTQKISMIGDDVLFMASQSVNPDNTQLKGIFDGYREGWKTNFAYADSLRSTTNEDERQRLLLSLNEYNRSADLTLNRERRRYRVERLRAKDPEFDCYFYVDDEDRIHSRPVWETAELLREQYGDDTSIIEEQEDAYWAYLEQKQQQMIDEQLDSTTDLASVPVGLIQTAPNVELNPMPTQETIIVADKHIEIQYKVQVLARYSSLIDFASYFMSNYSVSVTEEKYRFGDKILYQYVTDGETFKKATELRNRLIEAGIPDAWIVGYENGIRIMPSGETLIK